MLLRIKSYFYEIGTIITNDNYNFVIYKVYSLDEIIKVIIPHFNNYPLITQKRSDFTVWKDIVQLMKEGQHLKKESLIKIVCLKANLNKGLSSKLKGYFSDRIKI